MLDCREKAEKTRRRRDPKKSGVGREVLRKTFGGRRKS